MVIHDVDTGRVEFLGAATLAATERLLVAEQDRPSAQAPDVFEGNPQGGQHRVGENKTKKGQARAWRKRPRIPAVSAGSIFIRG